MVGMQARAVLRAAGFALTLLLGFAQCSAWAAYGNVPQDTDVDPTVMRIDEQKYLGQSIFPDYRFIDQNGREFTFGEMYGKPTILALSYYKCDGACSVLNRNLWTTLGEVKRWQIGRDFNVVTASFDPHDNPESMKKFMEKAGFKDGLPQGWRMSTFKDPADIKKLTDSIGYKFFWSPRDAMFLHPNVYMVVSPKGKVTRFLYGANISGQDMEISITKSMEETISPANVINFVLGACYSYNYKDGKYTVNIPIIIAISSLIFGLTLLFGSFFYMRSKKRRMAKAAAAAQADSVQ